MTDFVKKKTQTKIPDFPGSQMGAEFPNGRYTPIVSSPNSDPFAGKQLVNSDHFAPESTATLLIHPLLVRVAGVSRAFAAPFQGESNISKKSEFEDLTMEPEEDHTFFKHQN